MKPDEGPDPLSPAPWSVPLRILRQGAQSRQPAVFGVPFPERHLKPHDNLVLVCSNETLPVQSRVLTNWPDGSSKWIECSTHVPHGIDAAKLQIANGTPNTSGVVTNASTAACTLQCDEYEIQVSSGPSPSIRCQRGDMQWSARLSASTANGREHICSIDIVKQLQPGPQCGEVELQGAIGTSGLNYTAKLSLFASGMTKCCVTLKNPARAKHKGGYWDLGDPGSALLASLYLELEFTEAGACCWREQPGTKLQAVDDALVVYQGSSGGEHWDSLNHRAADGQVHLDFSGYHVRIGEKTDRYEHARANPIVSYRVGDTQLLCGLADFWQKFPSSLETSGRLLRIGFLPQQESPPHEIQGGEHISHTAWWCPQTASDAQTDDSVLDWIHTPSVVLPHFDWVASSGALNWVAPSQLGYREEAEQMLAEAIEGESNFFVKREVIDEYGWRNYGDMWADHEEPYCSDPAPVISHYNNQYDVLLGLLLQLLESGRCEWYQLAAPLARHLIDIDIYHAQNDKSAYCGGLFWHTAHYHDVGTATHRCMSRMMLGKEVPAPGGGPGNEHNYSTGLLLYYLLTGDEDARMAVVGLADWVIAMDDGTQHLLGLASDQYTGAASSTTLVDYHGPGRGTGNSINVLLDGWQLTSREAYLDKLEELIRRTIHPLEDIATRELENPELRWSYTVYLQALMRFIELTQHLLDRSEMHEYARQSILLYARWMVDNEYYYLDRPEKLEYPTETWGAQELRKGNVLLMAARLTTGSERERFVDRGLAMLDESWERLLKFPTRMFTRPLALVLQQAPIEKYFSDLIADQDSRHSRWANGFANVDFAAQPPATFEPQKAHVKRMLKSPSQLLHLTLRVLNMRRWYDVYRRSWTAQRLRKWFAK